MVTKETTDLIIELWSCVSSFVPAKDRAEAAEVFTGVFNELDMLDDTILTGDLDKDLSTAIMLHLDIEESDEEEDQDELY